MTMEKIDWGEIDQEFNIAIEGLFGHETYSEKVAKLPDSVFIVVYESRGKKIRKFPMLVKNDIELTYKNTKRAIFKFAYCPKKYKRALARSIVQCIQLVDKELGKKLLIEEASFIRKYTNVPRKYLVRTDVINMGAGISYHRTTYGDSE